MCERDDVFPSAAAVARAFPLYCRKTIQSANSVANSHEKKEPTVTVEFLLVDNMANPLTEEECLFLQQTAESVRTTARIVDMPCNEMNTDHFLEVNIDSVDNISFLN